MFYPFLFWNLLFRNSSTWCNAYTGFVCAKVLSLSAYYKHWVFMFLSQGDYSALFETELDSFLRWECHLWKRWELSHSSWSSPNHFNSGNDFSRSLSNLTESYFYRFIYSKIWRNLSADKHESFWKWSKKRYPFRLLLFVVAEMRTLHLNLDFFSLW